MAKMKTLPLIRMAEWLGGNLVRLFFSNGRSIRVVEMNLPGTWMRHAKKMRVVAHGMGLDPGDGLEISSWTLSGMRGRVVWPKKRRGSRRTSRR
jgi:hypothetical protein